MPEFVKFLQIWYLNLTFGVISSGKLKVEEWKECEVIVLSEVARTERQSGIVSRIKEEKETRG